MELHRIGPYVRFRALTTLRSKLSLYRLLSSRAPTSKEARLCAETTYGSNPIVSILANGNFRGVRESHILILGVEPSVYRELLAEPGMVESLAGKTLVAIVGGLSIKVLKEMINGDGSSTEQEKQRQCRIVRALFNTTTAVREDMTPIIEEDDSPYPTEILEAVCSVFVSVGQVKL